MNWIGLDVKLPIREHALPLPPQLPSDERYAILVSNQRFCVPKTGKAGNARVRVIADAGVPQDWSGVWSLAVKRRPATRSLASAEVGICFHENFRMLPM